LIAEVEWIDKSEQEQYRNLAVPALIHYGGRYLVRGEHARHEILEGDWSPERLVVIEFPSFEQAKEFWDSEANRAARPIRERGARSRVMFVDGVTAQPNA
jgi:uncharacterized protein (DUF1330 family)